jgi:RNA ligase (TIGR02306 family)
LSEILNEMRQLASIQKIKNIEPIEGADSIEKATVLGWQLVVKKSEFSVGDLVVYVEIDSILPDKPEFEFMKPRGMRVRTIRLRGQVSQGICFPLSILPDGCDLIEGADCTDILGVIKYEPAIPACLSGKTKGYLPSFVPKTDETRVQVLQDLLNKYAGTPCYITEKLDGSSASYYIKDGEFGVCSRNLDLIEDDQNSFWKVARAMDIENKMRSIGRNFVLQGELIGEGVQGNKLQIKGQQVRFFNAFDIDEFKYFGFTDFMFFLRELELPIVPLVNETWNLIGDIEKIVELSVRKSVLNQNVWAEGIVIRPKEERLDMLLSTQNFHNGRVSFKAINPEFLIKYGE